MKLTMPAMLLFSGSCPDVPTSTVRSSAMCPEAEQGVAWKPVLGALGVARVFLSLFGNFAFAPKPAGPPVTITAQTEPSPLAARVAVHEQGPIAEQALVTEPAAVREQRLVSEQVPVAHDAPAAQPVPVAAAAP